MIYIILFFSFLTSLCFYDGKFLQFFCAILSMLIFYKFVSGNKNCTISYFECKVRNIKKEKGVVYNALDGIYNLNNTNMKYFTYLFIIITFLINLKKIILS